MCCYDQHKRLLPTGLVHYRLCHIWSWRSLWWINVNFRRYEDVICLLVFHSDRSQQIRNHVSLGDKRFACAFLEKCACPCAAPPGLFTCWSALWISMPWPQGAGGLARHSPAFPRREMSILCLRRFWKAVDITLTPSYVRAPVYCTQRDKREVHFATILILYYHLCVCLNGSS